MGGEFFGSGLTHDQTNLAAETSPDTVDPGKIETDVSGVFADGKKDEMLGRLQVTLGKSKEQLRAIIASL